jgi:hypothetical protein
MTNEPTDATFELISEDVLYFYDRPILFTANIHGAMRLVTLLDEKKGEDGVWRSEYFAATPSSEMIDDVSNNRRQFRDAYDQGPFFKLEEVDGLCSAVQIDALDESKLPKPGIMLVYECKQSEAAAPNIPAAEPEPETYSTDPFQFEYDKTLFWYDKPILFTSKIFGKTRLVTSIEDTQDEDGNWTLKYVITSPDPQMLYEVVTNKRPMIDAYKAKPFFVMHDSKGGAVAMQVDELDPAWLPDADVCLESGTEDAENMFIDGAPDPAVRIASSSQDGGEKP